METSYPGFSFEVLPETPLSHSPTCLYPRLGRLTTPHGEICTPNFIFCATKAAVKGVSGHELADLNTEIILANTYHLMLQPGADLIHKQGGLHKFMNWSGPILTDSGGYQIFSMGFESVSKEIKRNTQQTTNKTLLQVNRDGATFRSYWNGEKIFLSPEISITVQRKLGADLIVQLDECTPFHIEKKQTEKSMLLSMHWGDRSLETFKQTQEHYPPQALYGVIQGGVYPDLREISTAHITQSGFFGIAIGGSLGNNRKDMHKVMQVTSEKIYQHLIKNKKKLSVPIHLLGIGKISDIFYGVKSGIDTFDCVHPTRLARHGWAIIPAQIKKINKENIESTSQINLNNSTFKQDSLPLDPSIIHSNDQSDTNHNNYSRSYVHHLLKAREINALTILTRHNIFQMNRLMADIRKGIRENRLEEVEYFWCGK